MSSDQTSRPRRLHRVRRALQNIRDSYTISRRTYPWVGWAMLGSAVALVGLAVWVSVLSSQPLWYWLPLAVLLALTVCMVILSLTVRRASYTQLEGTPGAAKAVLDQAGRGWYVESQPVAVSPRTMDLVWRMVGRPGVVLVAEGAVSHTRRMLEEEERKVRRVLSTVPVHVIHVGTGTGQVRLTELSRTLRQLPTKPTRLTDNEISQVSKRLESLASKGMSMPRGVDPSKARIDRRALRGR
ncbi:DUF4191 family protein [Actinomyces sp. 2119]|uniref:DUF4191 family protein n=1 Tax=Actinomyces lilanjuaniae TaxID=2321394 RepID=A0ABN5PRN9_9ACTO|nr:MULTISPECIES: DUF4191 domain-containing protein [Actinomyces]AYD89719.1 DUF4191 family protein [Actinomyces lilanjuaniae]RJF44933.1 DUF4191 family protein [Actinomyces sp. 2119]